MQLYIHDNLRLSDLQEKFNLCFPTLKIEFCTKKHQWEEVCPENELLPGDLFIGAVRKMHNHGTLELKSWDKVGEAEKAFQTRFGLNAQVFYRNGNRWIQTGKSDNLTIKDLEKKAYSRLSPVIL